MSNWKIVHAKLRSKLIGDSSDAAFDKKVRLLSSKINASPAAALYLMAQKRGVQATRDFLKLSHADQEAVRRVINLSTSQAQSMVNSPGATQVNSIATDKSRAKIGSKNTINGQQNRNRKTQKNWHETWWGIVIIGVAVTVFGTVIAWVITGQK